MAAWLRSTGLICVGAGMLLAAPNVAAQGIAGDMGARSRANVTISVSVAPRFTVTQAAGPRDVELKSNVDSARFSYRFVSADQTNALPDDKTPVILIVVPD